MKYKHTHECIQIKVYVFLSHSFMVFIRKNENERNIINSLSRNLINFIKLYSKFPLCNDQLPTKRGILWTYSG